MPEGLDRSVLPIRRPAFNGIANRTLGGSVPDWGLIGHVRPPAGAPNVLLVLIDDAGFGNPSTFDGPIDTPNCDRRWPRPALQPFSRDGDVLAHQGGAAHRAQPPPRRHGRRHPGVLGRLPRLFGHVPARHGAVPEES